MAVSAVRTEPSEVGEIITGNLVTAHSPGHFEHQTVDVLRIVVVSEDLAWAGSVREVLTAQLPAAMTDLMPPLRLRAKPAAHALIVDGRSAEGDQTARTVRAMGFDGAIVSIGGHDDPALGVRALVSEALAHALMPMLDDELARLEAPLHDQVSRARRLVAAGELALRLQHSLNNPLAGLLAEAQLMQMEVTAPEQSQALDRMVLLCRRMIEITRALDGVGERKGVSSGS